MATARMQHAASLVRRRYRRAHEFFAHKIWDTRLDELPARRAVGYRVARIAHGAIQAIVLGESLQVRAAALTTGGLLVASLLAALLLRRRLRQARA